MQHFSFDWTRRRRGIDSMQSTVIITYSRRAQNFAQRGAKPLHASCFLFVNTRRDGLDINAIAGSECDCSFSLGSLLGSLLLGSAVPCSGVRIAASPCGR